MADTKKNALKELAKELSDFQKYLHEEFKVGDRGLEKAQRIVAKLAKVKDITEFGCTHVREDMAIDAVEVSRAIAEEGTGDA